MNALSNPLLRAILRSLPCASSLFRRAGGSGSPRAILPISPLRHPVRPSQRDDAGQQLAEHAELRLRRRPKFCARFADPCGGFDRDKDYFGLFIATTGIPPRPAVAVHAGEPCGGTLDRSHGEGDQRLARQLPQLADHPAGRRHAEGPHGGHGRRDRGVRREQRDLQGVQRQPDVHPL